MTALDGWENFYVIVGSSAGALIGLQFVVITLIAQMAVKGDHQASGAFATPSVIHFGVVLLLSAIVSAPWNDMFIFALLLGLLGLSGIVYTIIVVRRMKTQTAYRPVFEDWLFHALLPFACYTLLAVSAAIAGSRMRPAMFLVGAASLVLLFTGIHNSWDAIIWHVFVRSRQEN